MADKTNAQYKEEARIENRLKEERKTSNETYALKIYEKAILAIIGAVTLGVLASLLKLVLK